MKSISTVSSMTLDGGVACLDFVNSGYDTQRDVVVERLHTYADLLTLSARLDLFEKDVLHDLQHQAHSGTEAAKEALIFGKEVRQLLYQLFTGIAGQAPERLNQDLIPRVNKLFGLALQYKVFELDAGKLRYVSHTESAGLMAPVWSVVLSAHELLETGNLQYVRQCGRCSWLFLDKTKSHRKKWCSMQSCGNSQKTKRYYQRKKSLEQ